VKRILVIALILLFSTVCYATDHPFTISWTANTDDNTISYKIYRTDLGYGTGGIRYLIATVDHPTSTYDFSVTIPNGVSALLTFVVVATNASGDAADSNTATALILFGVYKKDTPILFR
jgi:hypothetical protein